MKKLVLSLALVAGLGMAASAQTEGAVKKLSVGAEFGIPSKGSDEILVGGSLQYEHPVASALNLTLSAGYLSDMLVGNSKTYAQSIGYPTSAGLVPLKAGAKYYFAKNFYGAAELGAAISTETGGGTAFVFGPTLGTSFSVADKSALDFGVRYESLSRNGNTNGFFGLRAAFAFGL